MIAFRKAHPWLSRSRFRREDIQWDGMSCYTHAVFASNYKMNEGIAMINRQAEPLSVEYLGLKLQSPVIVGSCPLTIAPESVRQFAVAGAGAIVLPSMLQEQIVHWQAQPDDPATALLKSRYRPQPDKYNGGVENYLHTISDLKKVEKLPIIASLNGGSSGRWLEYAQQIQSSGADALEFHWQPMVATPNECAAEVEQQLCDVVRSLSASLSIPLAVKLNQRFTNLASIAKQLYEAGANGLTLFTHDPCWDVSIERMHWTIRWELSPDSALGGVLEGIVRSRTGGLAMSIAASGGVRTSEDALKAMIAGANVVMVTSEIYRSGPNAIALIVEGIHRYMATSRFNSLQEFQEARPPVPLSSERFERMEIIEPLIRLEHGYDPFPVAAAQTGDAFGHPRS